ncbi:MAG: hypothetical protein ACJ760_10630 [Thermoleophilaceae bacterium]
MKRLAPLLALAFALAAAPPAGAADPIMPLRDVRSGMQCTGLTVIRGTTISSFEAEVIDVVDDGTTPGAAILIRVRGPAVDDTGIAEGFSGSPIYCDRGDGVDRNIGAIAYGMGDYGNKLGLVTPIQAMIGQPVTPPAGVRRLTRRERRAVHPLSAPLTIAGLSPRLAARLSATAARTGGRGVYPVPAGPAGTFAAPPIVPGASLAAGLSSGAVAISAIGTVTYVDGNSVWGFGHPFDFGGRRSLLLQDAYVYTVVNNPNGDIGVSYKVAAAGHTRGTLSGDMLYGVTGTLGAPPPTTRLTVNAHDLDTARNRTARTRVADEVELGPPIGISPLHVVAPIAVLDATDRLLQADPGRETATLCLRATVAGHSRALRFCNRYVGDNSLAGNGSLLAAFDVDSAAGLIDSAQFRGLRIPSMTADLFVRRGLAQAYITHAHAPHRTTVARGLPVKLDAKVVRGGPRHYSFTVRLPRHLKPGSYAMAISGPGPDGTNAGGGGGLDDLFLEILDEPGGGGGARPGDLGVISFKQLAKRFGKLHQYDGLTARLTRRGRHGSASKKHRGRPALARRRAFRDPRLRIGGKRVLRFRVTG